MSRAVPIGVATKYNPGAIGMGDVADVVVFSIGILFSCGLEAYFYDNRVDADWISTGDFLVTYSIKFLKTWRNAILAGTATVALAACQMTSPTGGTSSKNNRPVNVALMVPSGSGSEGLEALAKSMINSARLAIAENPGVQVNLRIYATGGNPERGRELAKAARQDGVDIIVGPLRASVANEVGVEMARTNTSVLTMSNTGAIAGGNVFVMGNTYENTANRLVSFVSSRGLKSVVALASTDVVWRERDYVCA